MRWLIAPQPSTSNYALQHNTMKVNYQFPWLLYSKSRQSSVCHGSSANYTREMEKHKHAKHDTIPWRSKYQYYSSVQVVVLAPCHSLEQLSYAYVLLLLLSVVQQYSSSSSCGTTVQTVPPCLPMTSLGTRRHRRQLRVATSRRITGVAQNDMNNRVRIIWYDGQHVVKEVPRWDAPYLCRSQVPERQSAAPSPVPLRPPALRHFGWRRAKHALVHIPALSLPWRVGRLRRYFLERRYLVQTTQSSGARHTNRHYYPVVITLCASYFCCLARLTKIGKSLRVPKSKKFALSLELRVVVKRSSRAVEGGACNLQNAQKSVTR